MMNNNTLYNVPIGQTVRVSKLRARGSIRRRLLDMGLTRNARATCLYQSPFGDPRAYLIRGAVVALRSEDAKRVEIRKGGF